MIDRPPRATETLRMISSPSSSSQPSSQSPSQMVISSIASTTKNTNHRSPGVADVDVDEVRIRSRLLNTLGFTLSTSCTLCTATDNNNNNQKKQTTDEAGGIKNSQVSMLQHEGPRIRVSLNDSHLERERQREQEKYFKWKICTQHMMAMMMIHATAATATSFSMNESDDDDDDDDSTTSFLEMEPPSFASTLSQPLRTKKQQRQQQRVVRFDSTVIVQPIASHRQFSKRIKQTIWSSLEELQHMAYRNSLEFSIAEHSDPSQVLEDDDMYIDATTMEKIHPYWIEQHHSLSDRKRQQELVVDDGTTFNDGSAFIVDPRNIIDDDDDDDSEDDSLDIVDRDESRSHFIDRLDFIEKV